MSNNNKVVYFPIYHKNTKTLGLKTMQNRDKEQECSICYYDSENEQDSDVEAQVKQETLHNTFRYSQLFEWENSSETNPICQHQFHTVCLYNWFEKSKKMQCPVCKQGVSNKIVMPPLLKKPPRYVSTYHDNGKKKVCYFEINGLKHGPYEKYDRQGHLVLKRTYHNDLLNGYEIEYYPYTGKIRQKTKWILGKRNGKHWIRTSRGYYILKCSYENDLLHGDYREWYEGTHILKKGCSYLNGLLHGVLREWDKEQNLLLYSTYYQGGQWGRHMENYKSGKPHMKCFYNKQGNLDGIRVEFFKNGEIKLIEHYSNGIPIQFKNKFYSNGQQAVLGEYYNQKPDNTWREWYRNGNLKSKCTYEEGELFGKYTRYTERQDLIETAEYYNNLLDGKHIVMHPNKKPAVIENYVEGQLHGPKIEYDKNGHPVIKSEYKNGVLDGKYFDLNSGVKCEYKNGQPHGKWIQITNGVLLIEANFDSGQLHGPCKKLNENGNYITINYHYGQPLE
jgi:antitoxin component YwqK of YwqJK toxin-antitoxin module